LGSAVLGVSDAPVGNRGSTTRDALAAWRAVGRRGAAVVLAGGLATLLVAAWWLPVTGRVVATAASLLVLVVAALVDAVEHRLPNRLVALAALPVVAAVAVSWSADVARDALAGALVVAVPLLVAHLVAPTGMGFGDVKAGAVLGAALGLLDVQLAVFALVLGLGAGAAWGLTWRARSIPLGPALVVGALAALTAARLLGLEAR
jgi:leader peptidase (prepilin peptidase)/N-methyltransferase